MKRIRTTILALVLVYAMFAFFTVAHAQQIGSYGPTEHDFGSIALGNSVTQIFTVEVLDYGLLTIFFIDLGSNSSNPSDPYTGDSFEIIGEPPDTIPSGTSFEIEVSFSPTTAGAHNAYLWIVSDAANAPYNVIAIPLEGFGVSSEVPPEQIASILDFFDFSVADESLVGSGPNAESAENRLNALWNILLSAQDMIESGDYEAACEQLGAAYMKTDGQPIPPDFVEGEAADDLAAMILALMANLGC